MTVVLDYVSVMLEIVSTRLTEDVKLFSRGSRAQFEDIIAAANKHQTHAPERLVTPLHAPGDQTGLPRGFTFVKQHGDADRRLAV
jgi:hypothetical protein